MLDIARLLGGLDQPGGRRDSLPRLAACLAWCGVGYGAVMGAYGGVEPSQFRQIAYSAVKVPLLLTAVFAIAVPSFFVLNTLAGLRDDFASVLRALVSTQTVVTIVLVALAPYTALWYVSAADYPSAILVNAAMFAIATAAGQIYLRRRYRPLIARDRKHQLLLRTWLVTYTFVGIQMGWTLRPFIGNPLQPTQFLRADGLTNAYVFVSRLIWQVVFG